MKTVSKLFNLPVLCMNTGWLRPCDNSGPPMLDSQSPTPPHSSLTSAVTQNLTAATSKTCKFPAQACLLQHEPVKHLLHSISHLSAKFTFMYQ